MATYATYRHIELDKVGYSKKRVRNRSSEIFNVLCDSSNSHSASSRHYLLKRNSPSVDSFQRLFGTPENTRISPRRGSLTKHDVTHRNPVTGNGVTSWDSKQTKSKPKTFTERNPVTGETYKIQSPTSKTANASAEVKSKETNKKN